MPEVVRAYVRYVDAFNRLIGRIMMYFIFVMMGILLLSSTSRTFFSASQIWTVEMAQFVMTGYYLLGGGYSMQLDSHVRMDLLYSR
jgi:TRAP-type mannitol/chloroaromatic compound transport system permease small subunit